MKLYIKVYIYIYGEHFITVVRTGCFYFTIILSMTICMADKYIGNADNADTRLSDVKAWEI